MIKKIAGFMGSLFAVLIMLSVITLLVAFLVWVWRWIIYGV